MRKAVISDLSRLRERYSESIPDTPDFVRSLFRRLFPTMERQARLNHDLGPEKCT